MIQNDLFAFLWNGKKDKIKRSEMINDYEDGGGGGGGAENAQS